MNNEIKYSDRRRGSGKIMAGLILIAVGAVLVLRNTGMFFPGWLFDWPMILIIIGLFIGFKHQFRTPAPFVMLLIGSAFLVDRNFYGFNVGQFIWPSVIIIVGLWMIFGRKRHFRGFDPDNNRFRNNRHFRNRAWEQPVQDTTYTETQSSTQPGSQADSTDKKSSSDYSGDDFIDSVSVFGGVKKRIISKNFKGGDVVNFFGGADLDLTQADFSGRVTLDVTQVFGGTKIVVPANWVVVSEMAAIFGGIEDKRHNPSVPQDEEKVIVIKGTSIFAGIDVRSY